MDHHCRQQVISRLGYKVQNGTDDHALREVASRLCQSSGAQDGIQVEIDSLKAPLRSPAALLAAERRSFHLGSRTGDAKTKTLTMARMWKVYF